MIDDHSRSSGRHDRPKTTHAPKAVTGNVGDKYLRTFYPHPFPGTPHPAPSILSFPRADRLIVVTERASSLSDVVIFNIVFITVENHCDPDKPPTTSPTTVDIANDRRSTMLPCGCARILPLLLSLMALVLLVLSPRLLDAAPVSTSHDDDPVSSNLCALTASLLERAAETGDPARVRNLLSTLNDPRLFLHRRPPVDDPSTPLAQAFISALVAASARRDTAMLRTLVVDGRMSRTVVRCAAVRFEAMCGLAAVRELRGMLQAVVEAEEEAARVQHAREENELMSTARNRRSEMCRQGRGQGLLHGQRFRVRVPQRQHSHRQDPAVVAESGDPGSGACDRVTDDPDFEWPSPSCSTTRDGCSTSRAGDGENASATVEAWGDRPLKRGRHRNDDGDGLNGDATDVYDNASDAYDNAADSYNDDADDEYSTEGYNTSALHRLAMIALQADESRE